MQPLSPFKILIFDKDLGKTLVQYNHGQDDNNGDDFKNSLTTYLSFTNEGFVKASVDIIKQGERKIIYETSQNFVFVATSKNDYDILTIRRVLNHIKVEFLRTFPLQRGSWQFNRKVNQISKFESTINEIIFNFGFSTKILKIVLLGLDYAGKTTLTHAYADSKSQTEYLPTKALDILKMNYKGLKIHFWDLGGQKQFRILWKRFTEETSGILFVLDSSTDRWDEIITVYNIVRSMNLPFIVFANKMDLVDERIDIRFISKKLELHPNKIVFGSALLNSGIFEGLDLLIAEILRPSSNSQF